MMAILSSLANTLRSKKYLIALFLVPLVAYAATNFKDIQVNGDAVITGSLSSGALSIPATVTGTLSIPNGGTGQTTANAALNALLPSQVANVGKFLQTDGSNTSWQSAGGNFWETAIPNNTPLLFKDSGNNDSPVLLLDASDNFRISSPLSMSLLTNTLLSIEPGGSFQFYIGDEILNLKSYNGSVAPQMKFWNAAETFAVGLKAPDALAANATYTLPSTDGTSGQVLSTNGAGVLSFVTSSGGGANTNLSNLSAGAVSINTSLGFDTDEAYDVGGPSKHASAVYTSAIVYNNGQFVLNANGGIFLDPDANSSGSELVDIEGDLRLRRDSTGRGALRLLDGTNNANFVGFRAPTSVTTPILWDLPAADGSSGQFLRTNGAGTLSFANASSTLAYLSATSAQTITNATDYVALSGSSFTLTLFTAVGNQGKILKFRHGGTSLTNIYVIDANSTETIVGTLTFPMITNDETLTVISDGSNWQQDTHKAITSPASYTITVSAGFGTLASQESFWWRDGEYLNARGRFTGGTVAASVGTMTIPFNLLMDTAKFVDGGVGQQAILGHFYGDISTTLSDLVVSQGPYSLTNYNGGRTTQLLFSAASDLDGTTSGTLFAQENVSAWHGNASALTFYYRVPIVGWRP